MSKNIDEVINAIAEDVKVLIDILMESSSASNNQISIKELRDNVRKDDVVAKLTSTDGGNGLIVEVFYDSLLEWERNPQSGKYPSVSDIRDWASSKGLDTSNATINLVRRAIWWHGHTGQSILDLLNKEVNEMFQKEWADKLLDAVLSNLDDFFNSK